MEDEIKLKIMGAGVCQPGFIACYRGVALQIPGNATGDGVGELSEFNISGCFYPV